MLESLEENSKIDVANNLTTNDSKLFKTILKSRFYVEIKNIMQ